MTAYSTGPVVTASLMVHLYPGVPLRVSLHPEEDRAVVAIGTGTLLLDLFCDHAELVTLRDTLAAAVADLDTARQAIHDDTTGTATAPARAGAPRRTRSAPRPPDGRTRTA